MPLCTYKNFILIIPGFQCITETTEFKTLCLHRSVLENALATRGNLNGDPVHKDPPNK